MKRAEHFSHTTHGWTVTAPDGRPEYERRPTGGNPDGYFAYTFDNGDNYPVLAESGSKFSGDLAGFYGGRLTFDMFDNEAKYFDREIGAQVRLVGAGSEIYAYCDKPVKAHWTHETIALDTSAGWRFHGTDEVASTADIRAILSDLDHLTIRTDLYFDESDSGGLDNIAFKIAGHPAEAPEVADRHIFPALHAEPPISTDLSHVMLV